jgi:hypothetical protein
MRVVCHVGKLLWPYGTSVSWTLGPMHPVDKSHGNGMPTDPSPGLYVCVITAVYCSEATVARTFCRTDGGSGT